MLIDSHCHINSEELRADSEAIIRRAGEVGIGKMLIVGCDLEDSIEAVEIAHTPHSSPLTPPCYASIGVHPHEAKRYADVPEKFFDLVNDDKVVAVGEIGLDYHYDLSPRDVQADMFERQLDFAKAHDMPVILHIREAMSDAMKILHRHEGLKLLFHCYAGGLEYLDEVLELGGLCAFGGALTWKGKASEELREVFRRIPAERILLETDCPYMTPAPFRGKLNEPSYIKLVYERAAAERDLSVEELADIIERNAEKFFNWR
ncbi:MAG: TatD family hydrolase [Synergistaceae bacterium]|nr:TatD family hydrolase [Synergistaceae bacterium]